MKVVCVSCVCVINDEIIFKKFLTRWVCCHKMNSSKQGIQPSSGADDMKKLVLAVLVSLALVGCGSEVATVAPVAAAIDHTAMFDAAIAAKDGQKAYDVAVNAGICAQGLNLLEVMKESINTDDYVTSLGNLSAMCGLY